MKHFQLPGSQPTQKIGLAQGERKRLIFLTAGLVLVVSALLTSLLRSSQYRSEANADLPIEDDRELQESVHIPEIDGAALDALVKDRLGRDRVVLESDGVDAALNVVRLLTPRHFEAMEAREVTAEARQELLDDPHERRGTAFTVRGEIESLRTRHRGATNQEEHIGRILLEDGSAVYFLALEVPDLGGYVRFDGIFLKNFSDEDLEHPGTWLDGPLFVGPRAIRSYAPLGTVAELDPEVLASVRDDQLIFEDGSPPLMTGLPFEPLWHMVAFARDGGPSVDWEAVPELDYTYVSKLIHTPEEFRGQPFRIPISRLQGCRVRLQKENPARLDYTTEGWIGNVTWKNVIHFKAPKEYRDLRLRDHVYGNGFFFKNFAYESTGRGLRVAPVFVLESLERLEVQEDPVYKRLAILIAGTTIFLIGLMTWLLRRDGRKSKQLEAAMLARRRARRRNPASPDPAAP